MNQITPAVEIKNLTVSYGPKPAVLDVSLQIHSGNLVGIIGPNGSGKSTLVKTILGFIKPDIGEVKIFGKSIRDSKGMIAYVPQRGSVDWDYPITVYEVAAMGRFGYLKWYQDLTNKDHEIIHESLNMVKMLEFKDRQITQLSGGQQQRVFMARALAQGSEILILDEPFAGVDAATERAILEFLEDAKIAGRTLIVVHHDLLTAAQYFDSLILIKQRLYAFGPPNLVLREDLLSEVYEGKLRVFTNIIKESHRD